jgi:hypothetical protein
MQIRKRGQGMEERTRRIHSKRQQTEAEIGIGLGKAARLGDLGKGYEDGWKKFGFLNF